MSEAANATAKLIHNEKVKLFASALERSATACFTVGILTPVGILLVNGAGGSGSISPIRVSVLVFVWACPTAGLHILAQWALRWLR